MYQVSNAFLNAMKSPVQEHTITGTIGSVSFSEENIVDGSFSISNQSTDTSDVVLGSCYVGQLTAEFTGIDIAYGNWINKTITPSFGLKVGEYYEYVPLGVYKIKEAKHTDRGVQIIAYDNMIKFDKKFKKSHFMNVSGMTNIIDQLCLDAGVICGMSHAEIEALPNGDRTGINIYGSTGKKAEFANDITTLRDLLFWVAQTLGCFATINRAGQLEFRLYNQNVVDQITEQHRIAGATFADYITHYVGIYVENLDDNTEDYYGYDATALQQELTETMGEITQDQEDITDLEADRTEWTQKLANHECTQEEYDAAVAEINAQEKVLSKEIKQLTKRAEWLSNAIAQSADDGSDMVLGANPLVMAKNLTTRDAQRREILGALNAISYTPFQASVVCGCIYDLGDVIQFSGGLYNSDTDSFGCVMSYTYTHNGGTELEGFGVDPQIPVIRTKQQKSTDRAERNAYESARSTVGTVDPSNPDTPDDSVPGKNGDTYIQQVSKTVRKNISKTFDTWVCKSYIQNNLHWYSYGKITVSSDSGNFITVFAKQSISNYSWVVAGSKTRPVGFTYFIVKVPINSPVPSITAEISDVTEYNIDDPDKASGGWGQSESGTTFFFNPASAVTNRSNTYKYYIANCAAGGSTGGLREEINKPDYIFDNGWGDVRAALEDDLLDIPVLYDGSDGTRQYYNDGTGGDSAWKKASVVTGVDESDNAGGTENNGLDLNQETQVLSLKKNVVRAWYKADPPQKDRNFSQLCVRYTGSPDKQIQIVPSANHTWRNVKVTKDDDSVYKIKCSGSYDSESINYVVYAIGGLVQGKKYYFNFKCNFSDNAKFAYDMSIGCGIVFNDTGVLSTGDYSGDEDTFDETNKYYAFKRRPESWYADFGFTATASTMYMCILMQAMTDSSTVSFTLSELVISQKERQLIRNIYLYDYTAKEWLKYKPFSGSTSGGDEGGSVVAIEPTLAQGTKIADYSIDGVAGELYAPDNSYTLPIASDETLGGIKVGDNLSIEQDGTLNATGGADAVEITWAAYQALTAEQKADPTKVYYVTDYPTPSGIDLGDIDDVDLSSPTDGQVLKYYGTNQKWINANESGGGTPSMSDWGWNVLHKTIEWSGGFAPDAYSFVSYIEYVKSSSMIGKMVIVQGVHVYGSTDGTTFNYTLDFDLHYVYNRTNQSDEEVVYIGGLVHNHSSVTFTHLKFSANVIYI